MRNPKLIDEEYAVPGVFEYKRAALAEASRGEYAFSAGELFQIVRCRLWFIALVSLMLVGGTVGIGLLQTPTYSASIEILASQKNGTTLTPEAVGGLQQVTETLAEAVHSHSVAEAVIQRQDSRMSTEEFTERLNVQQIPNTQLIQVTYTDTSPERAQRVVDTTGEVFSEQIAKTSSTTGDLSASLQKRAVAPKTPTTPDLSTMGVIALSIGVMLGTGLACLLEYSKRPQVAKKRLP